MRESGKPPTLPPERSLTLRQALIDLLAERPLSVSALSRILGRSEKELYDPLEQLGATGTLLIVPATCSQCGYRFIARERAKKPGKCPQCKGSRIEAPLFSIRPPP